MLSPGNQKMSRGRRYKSEQYAGNIAFQIWDNWRSRGYRDSKRKLSSNVFNLAENKKRPPSDLL